MANAFTFEVKGLDQLQKKINNLPKELVERIDGELESSCQNVVLAAKANAPKNIAALSQSISFAGSNLGYTIRVGAKYGHIMEFGSKSKVSVPSELTAYASSFKGQPSGGTWSEFLEAMKKWVRRKGIGATYNVAKRRKNRQTKDQLDSIAYLIAMSIAKKGVKPQPFLFPAFFNERPKLIRNVASAIKNISI